MESGTNDPFAVFLTLMLVELISSGESSFLQIVREFAQEAVFGAIVGMVGGRLVVLALNRVALPQGLHAPFVAVSALVVFAVQIAAPRVSETKGEGLIIATGREAIIGFDGFVLICLPGFDGEAERL